MRRHLRTGRQRRGVILLIVLSLLVLFLLMLVSFLVVASVYDRGAKSFERYQRADASHPKNIADSVVYQLIRDTPHRSALQGQSLLADLYGNDGVAGIVQNWSLEPSGQFAIIHYVADSSVFYGRAWSSQQDYYNGRVFTAAPPAGSSRPFSARIVDSGVDASGNFLRIELSDETELPLATSQRFVVNGAPFNGTGAGFQRVLSAGLTVSNMNAALYGPDGKPGWANEDDDGDGTIDDDSEIGWPGSDDRLLALLPNYSRFIPPYASEADKVRSQLGGADESWDAVDYQNMFLAMVRPSVLNPSEASTKGADGGWGVAAVDDDFNGTPDDASEAGWPGSDDTRLGEVIPSFKRPELLYYWFKAYCYPRYFVPASITDPGIAWNIFDQPYGKDYIRGNADDPVALPLDDRDEMVQIKRMCTFRPLREDNPNFSGSNSSYHDLAATGLLQGITPADPPGEQNRSDVDNDGDGITDSIWIDPGLPSGKTEDGRVFKPLVALLIEDLDGRLNLNAHSVLDYDLTDPADPKPVFPANVYTAHPGPDGLFGGADDMPIVSDTTPSAASRLPRGLGFGPAEISLAPLFSSSAEMASILSGRYFPLQGWPKPVPGAWASDPPSIALTDDNLSKLKGYGNSSVYAPGVSPLGTYASSMDPRGFGAIAVDYLGNPLFAWQSVPGELMHYPYEFHLIHGTSDGLSASDSSYGPAELERLLRSYDADRASLASRLPVEAPGTFAGPAADPNRRMVTTLSSHIPSPNVTLPPELRDADVNSGTIRDLYRLRIKKCANPATPPDDVTAESIASRLMPWEFRKGQLFDLNRPLDLFVNGVYPASFTARNDDWLANQNYSASTDPNSNETSRQIYARHLFCLMMVLIDAPTLTSDGKAVRGYFEPVFDPNPTDPSKALTPVQRRELMVRRIAQWAVNVVDFRDSDAVCTGFEYDVNPFDGWNVDGIIGMDSPDDASADRRVVWGCEAPELLITETLAMHDRRVKDTSYDDNRHRLRGVDRDKDDQTLDQFRIPQGSLFVELFCPRNIHGSSAGVTSAGVPAELYTNTAGPGNPPSYVLDLARKVGNGMPVWQIAISEMSRSPSTYPSRNPVSYVAAGQHDTTEFTPGNLNVDKVLPAECVELDRFLWFTNSPAQASITYRTNVTAGAPATPELQPIGSHTFYNRGGTISAVAPGRYAVAGPRVVTFVGSRDDRDDMSTPLFDGTANQQISLSGAGVSITDMDGTVFPTPAMNVAPANGIVLTTEVPDITATKPWNDPGDPCPTDLLANGIGMNVSEPLPQYDYYPRPLSLGDLDAGGPLPTDAYYDPSTPDYTLPDVPVDFGGATGRLPPLAKYDMLATGTYENVRTLYLQRLADPTRPWNPEQTDPHFGHLYDRLSPVNPYITVDWATVDLTVFSGDEETNREVTGAASTQELDQQPKPAGSTSTYVTADKTYPPLDVRTDPVLPPQPRNPALMPPTVATRLATRKRGSAGGLGPGNMWNPLTAAPTVADESGFVLPPTPSPTVYFYHSLVRSKSTLGYLNNNYDTSFAPFPWLAFNNRPFVSPLELTLVPASSPSRLLYEFSAPVIKNAIPVAAGALDLYRGSTDLASASDFGSRDDSRWPFGHLLNLFQGRGGYTKVGPERWASTRTSFYEDAPNSDPAGLWTLERKAVAADYCRLFDFVETPSPYVGTERWYGPTVSASGDLPFLAPYNTLSKFRDPGRVNINTVFDPRVWDGISRNYPDTDSATFAQDLFLSRQGYGSDQSNFLAIDPSGLVPTRFANPFRSANSADLMPIVAAPFLFPSGKETFVSSGTSPNSVYATLLPKPRCSSDATLLREGVGNSTSIVGAPLFAQPKPPARELQYRDTRKNASFAYQGMNRLGNLLTTHSNVFAVWMTIGYFELEENPAGADITHPDGYRLGPEIGIETGTAKRHRAFYIIDRSIPVGFEPGVNHNVDKAILVNRMIE